MIIIIGIQQFLTCYWLVY